MRTIGLLAVLLGLTALGVFSHTALCADKLNADVVISKHLDSIGKPEARAAMKSRVAQGKVVFGEIITHSLRMEGAGTLLSQGRKVKCVMQFGNAQYPGEEVVFDGQKAAVSTIDPTNRSSLGSFLYQQEEVVRDGLFGGTLSTAWVLLNQKEVGGKLKYEGLKKIDKTELYDLTYVSKKPSGGGELIIHFYFEPETFRHVRTVYAVRQHNVGGSIQQGNDETRRILEERFSDFAETDGITLPRHWDIRYRTEPQTKTKEYQWDITILQVQNNPI